MKHIKLLNKIIGDGNPCYFIAEIGGAFRSFEEAKRLIDSAVEIGIDAVKFQTLEAETITTKNNYFDMDATGKILQYDVFKNFELTKELQLKIVRYAKDCNMPIFSAPSHMKDLDLLYKMDLPFYKIGSDLACHIPLLEEIAKLGKPIILSTGMCTLDEVQKSVEAIRDKGNDEIALLHCVSNYPSKPEESNLLAIQTMKDIMKCPVGLSDHCVGTLVSIGAASIGANLIEKHFRDARNSPSPDDIHSLTKDKFAQLMDDVRLIEQARGNGIKNPTSSERKNSTTNRVSIVSIDNISRGEIISENKIDIRRPGIGLQPMYWKKVIGAKAKVEIKKDQPITLDMIEFQIN
ncbi:MAG TPA: N-acetylneuraminate synthase family protein [Candidatus Nitrosotalea sp.]|nr:N-acetylneuraminate synthase family protein [Candidatus Nitrosotalea sp.]